MKTYKQFLNESIDWKSYDNGYDSGVESHKTFDGKHEVRTYVTTPKHKNDHPDIGYTVNGYYNIDSTTNRDIPKTTKNAIALHVARTTEDYISKHKPNSIQFSAFNGCHEKHFHKFAIALADKHGYDHKVLRTPGRPGAARPHILTKKKTK